MIPGLRSVVRGLSLARFGLWWVVTFVVILMVEGLAIEFLKLVEFFRKTPWAGHVYGWGMTLTGLAAFAGFVVAFVGRCFCLATPEGMPVVRTRIRLAVLLEACGWVSGMTNVFVGYAVALRVVPVPMIVAAITGGFSLLLLVLGRLTFLRFAAALAETLAPSLVPLARRSLVLFVVAVVCGVATFVLFQLANYSLAPAFAYPACGGFAFAAATVGVSGLFVYARLLRRLRDSALCPNPLHAHEPEEVEPPTRPEHALVAS